MTGTCNYYQYLGGEQQNSGWYNEIQMSELGITILLFLTCTELKQLQKHTLSVSTEITAIDKGTYCTKNR